MTYFHVIVAESNDHWERKFIINRFRFNVYVEFTEYRICSFLALPPCPIGMRIYPRTPGTQAHQTHPVVPVCVCVCVRVHVCVCVRIIICLYAFSGACAYTGALRHATSIVNLLSYKQAHGPYPRWRPTKSVDGRVCRWRGRRRRTTATTATPGHRRCARRPGDRSRCRTFAPRNGRRNRRERRPNWSCPRDSAPARGRLRRRKLWKKKVKSHTLLKRRLRPARTAVAWRGVAWRGARAVPGSISGVFDESVTLPQSRHRRLFALSIVWRRLNIETTVFSGLGDKYFCRHNTDPRIQMS